MTLDYKLQIYVDLYLNKGSCKYNYSCKKCELELHSICSSKYSALAVERYDFAVKKLIELGREDILFDGLL